MKTRPRWGRDILPFVLLSLARGPALSVDCPAIDPSPDWKGEFDPAGDPFLNDGLSVEDPRWIKFTILTCDLSRVYFQDSKNYTFHYDFARERMAPFLGIGRADFDLATLHADGQQAFLGAILVPPPAPDAPPEYGIQLVRKDPYTVQEVIDLVNAVRARVTAGPGVRSYYFPAFEQIASARENASFLEKNGISLGSTDRWLSGNRVHSPGWALGVLKSFPASGIDAAFLSGELRHEDILLTDGVPADTPLVAGILSLAPVTPNSHMVILSTTFQIPLIHIALARDAARAQSLVGRRVVVRGDPDSGGDVRLLDAEGRLNPQQVSEILDLKKEPPIQIAPIARLGRLAASTDALTPADIDHFGGKASYFGFLRRAIPADSPVAAAFSFDLWMDFLDQTLPGGPTLREHAMQVIERHPFPPADPAAFATDMEALRNLFRDETATRFTPAQEAAILDALQDPAYGLQPERKIRFRSSTNVEDTASFTGAGLYDSYSGCLADDLDGETSGPSACDPGEPGERGVFRAIRRVFGSFFNPNAVLERRRHGVDEESVGMAVLVHHSFPDPQEMANGVATLRRTPFQSTLTLVTQLGAEAVTNPSGDSIPEEVVAYVSQFGTSVYRQRGSNLVQLGATVMEWEDDYRELVRLLVAVADRYAQEMKVQSFVLDFEYKKEAPRANLSVKQVRPIPQPDPTPRIVPFLLDEPTVFTTFQGEAADVFSDHRLKSRWTVESESLWLTEANLAAGFHAAVSVEFTDGCEVLRRVGTFSSFPSAAHGWKDGRAVESWSWPDLGNPRSMSFVTEIGQPRIASGVCPIWTLRDLQAGRRSLEAAYRDPEGALTAEWDVPPFSPVTRTSEGVVLSLELPQPDSVEELQERTFEDTARGVAIETRFWWLAPPGGFSAGYTAPLTRWVHTDIRGLTADPISLRGYYSQTIRPAHHNFAETFLFDPFLEPGIAPGTLDELREKGIRLIFVHNSRIEDLTVFRYLDQKAAGMLCGSPGARFVRGDANADGAADLSDAIAMLFDLFLGKGDIPCRKAADSDGDGRRDISDLIHLLAFLFLGGEAPGEPFPACGTDPTPDELSCEAYERCL